MRALRKPPPTPPCDTPPTASLRVAARRHPCLPFSGCAFLILALPSSPSSLSAPIKGAAHPLLAPHTPCSCHTATAHLHWHRQAWLTAELRPSPPHWPSRASHDLLHPSLNLPSSTTHSQRRWRAAATAPSRHQLPAPMVPLHQTTSTRTNYTKRCGSSSSPFPPDLALAAGEPPRENKCYILFLMFCWVFSDKTFPVYFRY
jgi:hypothetical protein